MLLKIGNQMLTLVELFMLFAIIASVLYACKLCLEHYRSQE